MEGGISRSTERSLLQTMERMATALEKLASEDEHLLQVEWAPPLCPHCGKFSPEFHIEADTYGPLAECVLYGRCGNCQQHFFAMPVTWHMYTTREQVEGELQERAEMVDGHKGNT